MLSIAAIPASALVRRLRSGLSPMTPLTGGNPSALDVEAVVMRNTHRFGSELYPLLAYDAQKYPQQVRTGVASAIENAVQAEADGINRYLLYEQLSPSQTPPQQPSPSSPGVPSVPGTPSTPSAPNTPSPGVPGTPSPPLPPVVLFPPSPGSGGGGGFTPPSPPQPASPSPPRVFIPLGPPRRSPSPVQRAATPSPQSPMRPSPPRRSPPQPAPQVSVPPVTQRPRDQRPLSPFYAQALQYMTNNEPIMARSRAAVLCSSHPVVRAEARAQLKRQGDILTANVRLIEKETQACDFLAATRQYREIRETLLRIYQSYYRCMGASGAEVKEIDALGRPVLESAVDTRH